MLLSVIIPVFNAADFIGNCVKSLQEQSLNSNHYEVIFVDNNSKDKTVETIRKLSKDFAIVNETKQGSYYSRNRGIREANGQIMCFTDADCYLHKDWLKHIYESFSTSDLDVLQGQSTCTYDNQVAQAIQLLYQDLFVDEVMVDDVTCKRIDTRNCAISLRALEQVGLFNERMKFWGDAELGTRLTKAGYHIAYNEDVLIDHKNIDDIHVLKKKKLKEGYTVYKQVVSHGRRHTMQHFPTMLFAFLRRDDISHKISDLESQLEILLEKDYITSSAEEIKDDVLDLMNSSFMLGLYMSMQEEVTKDD